MNHKEQVLGEKERALLLHLSPWLAWHPGLFLLPGPQRSSTGLLLWIAFGQRPKFPSGMQLKGGKWQFLTPHISSKAE